MATGAGSSRRPSRFTAANRLDGSGGFPDYPPAQVVGAVSRLATPAEGSADQCAGKEARSVPDAITPRTDNARRPVGVRLNDVLTTVLPPLARVIASTCTDRAERVRNGDVYFALETDAVELLPRVQRAIELGAAAVVTSELLPLAGTPQFVVADPRQAYGDFCQSLVGNPTSELPLTVVTGGRGKSTVARLLRSIGRAARLRIGCIEGGQGHDGCQPCPIQKHPNPIAAAKWLSRSLANGCSHAVAESPLNATHWLAGAQVQTVCLTNAVDAQRLPPRGVFKSAETLVVNTADAECQRYASTWRGPVATFGLSPTDVTSTRPDVRGRVLERHAGGQQLLVEHGTRAVVVDVPGLGDAFAQNCLAAIATAAAWGIDLQTAAAGIEGSGAPRRMMRPIVCGQEFPVYLDAADSPATIREATQSLESIAEDRVLTVLDAVAPIARREAAIAAACEASDIVVVVGLQTRGRFAEQVRFVDDRFAAVALALALAEAGDAVVVLGENDAPEPSSDIRSLETTVRELLALRLAKQSPTNAERFAGAAKERMKPEEPC